MDAHCDWNGIIAGMADDKCSTCNCRQTHTHYQLTIVINIIIIIATSSLDTTYDMEGKVNKRTERDRWRYVDDKTKDLRDRQVRCLLRYFCSCCWQFEFVVIVQLYSLQASSSVTVVQDKSVLFYNI